MSEPLRAALGFDDEPIWRTAEDLAVLFDVKISTVWAWRRRGHITRVDGYYDLVQALRWHSQDRDTRKDEIRRGVAQSSLAV